MLLILQKKTNYFNGRKVPITTPISKGNKYVVDFKEKANYFNTFLGCNVIPMLIAQCFPINRITASSLESITISESEILKTIRPLETKLMVMTKYQ